MLLKFSRKHEVATQQQILLVLMISLKLQAVAKKTIHFIRQGNSLVLSSDVDKKSGMST